MTIRHASLGTVRHASLGIALALALGACAAEPPAAAAPPPPAAKVEAPKPEPARNPNTALTESMRAALIRAHEALVAGKIDAAAFERIIISHHRTVAALGAVHSLATGNFPPPPTGGPTPSSRPPTRAEAIERLIENLYQPETGAAPRPNPRR
ncbi:hypothetical protein [Paramagnetospirillum marisnigri]|nr:hypothetical protein [Paramagnetospirillum marisnigri]